MSDESDLENGEKETDKDVNKEYEHEPEPQTSASIVISSATLQGDSVTMTGLTVTGTTDYSTGSGGGSTDSTQGTVQWAWNQLYLDPSGYAGRIIQPGSNSWLPINSGKWPVGYKVPDNKTKGGVYPSGSSDGTKPILIQPTPKGTGRLKFFCGFKFLVCNESGSTGSYIPYIGTYYSSENNKPLYPYLGVAHDSGSLSAATIPGGHSRLVYVHRLDIVDIAFQSDQPIPGWPNWEMNLHAGGTMMYPALQITVQNTGSVPLRVKNIHAFGYAC